MKYHTTEQLRALSEHIHESQVKWWVDLKTGQPIERNEGECLMLVVTELAEAIEGIRKGLMDDKLPHRKMEEVEMADATIRLLDASAGFGWVNIGLGKLGNHRARSRIKSERILNIVRRVCMCEEEFTEADKAFHCNTALTMIESYCMDFNLDLDGALIEKHTFNLTREDHQPEARLAAGGKTF